VAFGTIVLLLLAALSVLVVVVVEGQRCFVETSVVHDRGFSSASKSRVW